MCLALFQFFGIHISTKQWEPNKVHPFNKDLIATQLTQITEQCLFDSNVKLVWLSHLIVIIITT